MKRISALALLLMLFGCWDLNRAESSPTGPVATVEGFWEGNLVRLGQAWRVNLNISSEQEKAPVIVELPDDGLYDLPFGIRVSDSNITIGVQTPEGTLALFNGVEQGDHMSGTFQTNLIGGGVLDASFSLERTGPPQPLYREETVRFNNGPVTLVGTLVLPATGGPFAAVVWSHGSGADGRDTLSYRSRAYLLARHGIASLIYDKRGVGESTGDFRTANLQDLANDALAGAALLRDRADIDPHAVGIGGMSQGGWIAPLAASQSAALAFVVVGATPGITPAEQNIFDVANILRNADYSEDVVARASDLQRRVYQFFRTSASRAALQEALDEVRTEPWFSLTFLPGTLPTGPIDMSVLDFDPIPVWERVRVPVLSMWGELDRRVPVEESKQIIEAALGRAGNTSVTTIIFAQADHGFNVVLGEDDPWDCPRLALGFHDMMVEWVAQQVNE